MEVKSCHFNKTNDTCFRRMVNRTAMLHCLLCALASTTPLSTWLEEHGAVFATRVDVDDNGLRGLKWNHNLASISAVACRIPRSCAIVAGDFDSLAYKVLKECTLGDESEFSVYLNSLPTSHDLGCSWTREQLDRLVHEPTKRKFTSLGEKRMNFINNVLAEGITKDNQLAGRVYDLVCSRAVEGRFGRQGTVRKACLASVAGILVSFGRTTWPLLFGLDDNAVVHLSMEAVVPLIASFSALAYTLSNRNVELALVPWLDFANHDTLSAPSVFEYDIMNDAISWKVMSKRGEWATYDYGGSAGATNDRLLGEYGFVEIDNPNDTLLLELADCHRSIGRNGRMSEPPNDLVLDSAQELRKALANGKVSPPDLNDPVDVERSRLADVWRQEKIRLLDELMLKYARVAQDTEGSAQVDPSVHTVHVV
jgi:hypothetical protein